MFKKIILNKVLISLPTLLLIFSCSTPSFKSERPEVVADKKLDSESDSEIVSRPVNRSRIIGSAHIEDVNLYQGKTYYLYGAEQLKLENYYFDIPVVYNESVKKWIDYFLNRGREYFESYSARAGRYAPLMGKILEEQGLPRDLIFLAMAESGFQTNAKSWAFAVGPWQFMPYTGKRFGLKIDWYIDERRDPIKATIAAALYLKKLYSDFGSWELAAAAYNAGEGKVSKAIRKYNSENFWTLRQGRYLKSETKNYVPKIMALAIIGKNLNSFSLENIDFHEPLDFDEIELPKNTDLEDFSVAIGVDFEEIQRLNPELMRWYTPPNIESYKLRVPVGLKKTWDECCKDRPFLATQFQKIHVEKGTNLDAIAKKYKIKSYVLEDLNGQSAHQYISKGTEVLLPFRENHNIRSNMYADLYDRPRKEVTRRKSYSGRIKMAQKKGKRILSPKEYYVVRKGDSLWDVSKKTGTDLDTIINSNLTILNNRMIRAGDRLVVH